MRSDNDKNTEQPVKTVFLSGSRSISRLNDDVRGRVRNVIDKGFQVIIGDANGADKALQKFLADSGYRKVTVYCAGNSCRNNLGGWETHNVSVDPKLTGRDFYTQKDKEMASDADYGLVLWDGKSAGSINNVFELLKGDKCALVYLSSEKRFYDVKSLQDAQSLLGHCDKESMDTIKRKIGLGAVIKNLEAASQGAFSF
jgi:hypothetical protein